MNNKFSPKVKQIINRSREEAARLGHDYIGTEHLLLGLVADKESLAVKVLESLAVNTQELRLSLEEAISNQSGQRTHMSMGNISLNSQAEKVLKVTILEAKVFKAEEIAPEHLLLSILKHETTLASKILNQFDVDYKHFKDELEYMMQEIEMGTESAPNIYSQAPSDDDGYDDDEGAA